MLFAKTEQISQAALLATCQLEHMRFSSNIQQPTVDVGGGMVGQPPKYIYILYIYIYLFIYLCILWPKC